MVIMLQIDYMASFRQRPPTNESYYRGGIFILLAPFF